MLSSLDNIVTNVCYVANNSVESDVYSINMCTGNFVTLSKH